MAWKYKQEYVADGDVVEPSEWRVNINETVSEINGFLDTDNIKRDAITRPIIKRNTFTRVYSNDVTTNMSVPDGLIALYKFIILMLVALRCQPSLLVSDQQVCLQLILKSKTYLA
jgi:hypothetical protein